MEINTKKSLGKKRLVLFTVLSAIVSVALGGLIVYNIRNYLIDYAQEQYKSQQRASVNSIHAGISQHVDDAINKLKIIAVQPEIINYSDQADCNKKLDQLLIVTERSFNNLGRVNTDNRFVCSANRQIIGQETTRYGTYIGELIKDPEHKPVMSHLLKGLTGVDGDAIALHVPVNTSTGKFDGTIGGAIYVKDMEQKFFSNARLTKNSTLALYDDNGDIIYHPDPTLRGKNINDTAIASRFNPSDILKTLHSKKAQDSGTLAYSLDKEQRLTVYETFEVAPGRYWAITIAVPERDIAAIIDDANINAIFGVLIGVLTLCVTAVTFVTGRNLYKLVELDAAKDEFVSLASHQLKTPATAVKQSLGVIIEGYTKNRAEEKKFIETAYKSNDEQLEIIEDILNVARLDSGRLETKWENIDIREIAEHGVDELQGQAKEKEQQLSLEKPEAPLIIKADKLKLTMVIGNLISNAIKYTQSGGKINVTVSDTGHQVTIKVADNGMGISKDNQKRLFGKFERISSDATVNTPGTGLGLYLVKRIVEMHNGTIGLDSEPGRGTTFIVQLPKGDK